MKRLAFFLLGVALSGLILLPYSAHAATTMTPVVEGLAGGTFKPLSMPSLVGPNFSATGSVFVNGKAIPIPGYIPPASTAAQAARNALWLNPWLVGAALLTWAGDAGLGSDQVGGWQKSSSAPATAPWLMPQGTVVDGLQPQGCRSNSGGANIGYCDATMDACRANYGVQDDHVCVAVIPGHYNAQGQYVNPVKQGGYSTGAITGQFPLAPGVPLLPSCPENYADTGAFACTVIDPNVGGETVPATQADFDALPAPSSEVYRELAPQVGVPVDAPVYEPVNVPVGDPYTKPDGSTAQPMAQISPASNGQVTVDVYEMPLTDPQGNPVTDPQPQDTPEPQPTDCDKYPTSVGCTDLGTPPLGEDMPHAEQPITFTPVPISANATCPAPITVNGFGQTLTIDYSSACTYASGLRPIVIAIGYLTALFIIFGVPRSAQS